MPNIYCLLLSVYSLLRRPPQAARLNDRRCRAARKLRLCSYRFLQLARHRTCERTRRRQAVRGAAHDFFWARAPQFWPVRLQIWHKVTWLGSSRVKHLPYDKKSEIHDFWSKNIRNPDIVALEIFRFLERSRPKRCPFLKNTVSKPTGNTRKRKRKPRTFQNF